MPKISFRVTGSRISRRFMGALNYVASWPSLGSNRDAPESPDHLDREQERHRQVHGQETEEQVDRVGRYGVGTGAVHLERREDRDRIERLEPGPELVPQHAPVRIKRPDRGVEERGNRDEERDDAGGEDEGG